MRYHLEKLHNSKCVLQYGYEGGICSVLQEANNSYIIIDIDTFPVDDPEPMASTSPENPRLHLSLTDTLISLQQRGFLRRRVKYIESDFYKRVRNLKTKDSEVFQNAVSMFLGKCKTYLSDINEL